MKELIAKTRVPYGGKYRAIGERFQASTKHAHILVTIGKCEYAPVEPPKPPPAPARRRGRPTNAERARRLAEEAEQNEADQDDQASD